ncbi:glycosyltransferase family 2 protein [Aestuariibacter halophilus]|uniref:Glycosyltransferase family 2 protein n=1 Tax=Fluctibacter halophilus TaxID=226011 RepID=A0ABS8GE80_9ALTE|nr:glycosyltransferase family 2 protein [Aestuariibacter halophilus]MCC2617506.1 glycosyltransferase family 2 protein [Aestuariibacter halophilus]
MVPTTSVILTTYNSPLWLEKVLWGFHHQSVCPLEIIIADDGSTSATEQTIDKFRSRTHLRIQHIWQPDDGFQKCRILNKAIRVAKGDYLVFTDGDCIPRNDFVQVHQRFARPGHFLSGGYFKLSLALSQHISDSDIATGRAFAPDWLVDNGLAKTHKLMKLRARGITATLLNHLTPTKATWNGHNASGWKRDILAVNGFDERMQYGGEDRELGERMINHGIRPRQIRYSAVCVHLDHERGYVSPEMIRKNRVIRKNTRENRRIWTPFGLVKD